LQFMPRRRPFVARRSRRARGLPTFTLIESPLTPRRTAMNHALAARFSAFSLAALLTIAMLGSVNHLASIEPAAQSSSVMAAASKPAA
jgi:hypothetical protein